MPETNLTAEIKKRSSWSIFMGIITAALGVFLITYPGVTGMITTLLLGWVLILAGIAQLVFALQSQTVGNFFMKVLLGLLYVGCGIALAFFPISGVQALTLSVGILLLIYAGVAIAAAFQLRPIEGWGWFLFDGVTSLLIGLLILARWPSSSFWAIGTLVGAAVTASGISRIMIGATIRRGVATIDRTIRRAA